MANTAAGRRFEEALKAGRVSFCLCPESQMTPGDVYSLLMKNADKVVNVQKDKVTIKHLWNDKDSSFWKGGR